jgi:fatty-acid desaturase
MLNIANLKLVRDLIGDPWHRFCHRYYWGIHLMYASTLFLIDPKAVIYAHLLPACFLWQAGSGLNTMGHLFGYRNYKTRDHSRNNFLLAFLMWGEGWHNNHHAYPRRKYFGLKWYEFDLSGCFIFIIESASAGVTTLKNSRLHSRHSGKPSPHSVS